MSVWASSERWSDRTTGATGRRAAVVVLLGLTWLAAMPAVALAAPGRANLILRAARLGAPISSTQFGAFLEEINHSGDGGLYAELVRNRDLKEDSNAPIWWSQFTTGQSTASVALDSTQPLTSANPLSLKLSIGTVAPGKSVGVANWGYWGVPVRPSTTYRVSFFAKSSRASSGVLSVSLVRLLDGKVWASAKVNAVTNAWARYTAVIRTPAGIPPSLTNRFVISTSDTADSNSTMWFAMVSLFPPTYHGLANGFRIDLMQKISALRPGYFRIPGGNYLEGDNPATRFDWKTTLGPIEDRPGHDNSAWGYWSQDGIGLLEWLELAEQVHAQPILAVYDGYSLDGIVTPPAALQPYVKDALDEIQYAIGPTSSPWGAQRAADGHPAPFDVRMIEVGNEDNLDPSGSYNAYRYAAFYDAIKAAYPQLRIMATAPVTSRPMDVLDEHFYDDSPSYFAAHAHAFDHVTRRGPKIIVGEYAATTASPTGTMSGALGEAAFLTGIERNADLVIGASYAPLLTNVNEPNWYTNLIGYNGVASFVSPSYWVLRMFSADHGRRLIASRLAGGNGKLFEVASRSPGHTFVLLVNDSGVTQTIDIRLTGLRTGARGGTATVLMGKPSSVNTLFNPNAIVPAVHRLGRLGSRFSSVLPAESVTALNLHTS